MVNIFKPYLIKYILIYFDSLISIFVCIFFLPSFFSAFIDAPKKRGPPKGYIEALETRLQRMESILGGLVQSGDLPEGTISSNLEWINVNESNFRSSQEPNSL